MEKIFHINDEMSDIDEYKFYVKYHFKLATRR